MSNLLDCDYNFALSPIRDMILGHIATLVHSGLYPNHANSQVMQSQMIGLQSSLDRILSTLQHAPQTPTYANGAPRPDMPHHSGSSAAGVSPDSNACHPGPSSRSPTSQGRKFSPLAGFAPPPHRYGMYGTVLSNSPSDGESDDALCETRQRLTNATAVAPAVSLAYAHPSPTYYTIHTH